MASSKCSARRNLKSESREDVAQYDQRHGPSSPSAASSDVHPRGATKKQKQTKKKLVFVGTGGTERASHSVRGPCRKRNSVGIMRIRGNGNTPEIVD